MKPVNFPGANVEIARDQEEYLTLPAHRDKHTNIITSCWELSFWDWVIILFTGRVYVQIMTFGKLLQPQKLTVDNPVEGD